MEEEQKRERGADQVSSSLSPPAMTFNALSASSPRVDDSEVENYRGRASVYFKITFNNILWAGAARPGGQCSGLS